MISIDLGRKTNMVNIDRGATLHEQGELYV